MHDVKNTRNYKDLPLRGTHWYIKNLMEKIYNNYNNVLILKLYQLSSIDTNLFKTNTLFKWKTVSIKFRKILQERRLPILKFSQDNPQKFFWTFWLHKNIFITLQYPRDILEIFLKQKFVECSSNIPEETLLCD